MYLYLYIDLYIYLRIDRSISLSIYIDRTSSVSAGCVWIRSWSPVMPCAMNVDSKVCVQVVSVGGVSTMATALSGLDIDLFSVFYINAIYLTMNYPPFSS
jgi:hypothetical protein